MRYPEMKPLGEQAVIVKFGEQADSDVRRKVLNFMSRLEREPFPGLIEAVCGHTTAAVYYDLRSIAEMMRADAVSSGVMREDSARHGAARAGLMRIDGIRDDAARSGEVRADAMRIDKKQGDPASSDEARADMMRNDRMREVSAQHDAVRVDAGRAGKIHAETEHATVQSYVVRLLTDMIGGLNEKDVPPSREIVIPVCYGGRFGPDLPHVAGHAGLTEEQVIELHLTRTYHVYMMGFAPGFPYLSGMDPRIAAPRRSTPRVSIPAGSVGIAGAQTGIYPIETPGGWNLIGRTPLILFDPDRDPPSMLRAGDRIRFRAITEEQYEELYKKRFKQTARRVSRS